MPTSHPCEACGERAILLLYARSPGTKLTDAQRGDNPFYSVEEADISYNLCCDCFTAMTAQLRDKRYVAIRATASRPRKNNG